MDQLGMLAFNSLSRDHMTSFEEFKNEKLETFNSLSRDHLGQEGRPYR